MLKTVPKPPVDAYTDEPPQPLGETGRAMWDAFVADRDLPDELSRQLLFQSCDATEQAAILAKQIERDGGPVIETKTGRLTEHPAVRPLLHFKALAVRSMMLLKKPGPGSPGRPPGPRGHWYGDDD